MGAAFASLLELNGQLRSGSVKARQLVRQTARALLPEAAPGGAVRTLLEDQAMAAARAVEKDLNLGRTRGILQGVPFGVSELLQTARLAPPWDAGADPGHVEDAAAVSRLRSARALPLAVLSSPFLGGVSAGLHAAEDSCAAVVARGLLPFAAGLDFNGNVLRAALRRGCWALRPTFGTVSGFGTAPVSWTMAAVSVVARSPEDCGHVLTAISGGDSRCHHSPGRSFRFAPEFARPPRDLRVADTGVSALLREAAARSAPTVTVAAQPPGSAADVMEIVIAAEAGEVFENEFEGSAQDRQYLEDARSLSAFEYLRAMRLRRAAQDWYNELLSQADAVLFELGAGERSGQGPDKGSLWLAAVLLSGAPALACGGGPLPPFCLAGRRGSENVLLVLAAAIAGGSPPPEKS